MNDKATQEQKNLSDEVVRAQGYCAQARYYIDLACGLLEMGIVMSEGEWTEAGRNVYARILLQQVLEKRPHPGNRKHPHIAAVADTVSELKVPPGRWVFYFDKASPIIAQRGDEWQVRYHNSKYWIHDLRSDGKDLDWFDNLTDALFAIQDEDPWVEPSEVPIPELPSRE